MKIERLNHENEELWKNFVNNNSEAKFQHLLGFKEVIERSYSNCGGLFYLLLNKNKVKAVFLFILVRSKLFGNRIISLPFLDNGGFLGEYNEHTLKKIIELLKEEGIKKIEVRLNSCFKNFEGEKRVFSKSGFDEKMYKQQFIIALTNETEMWKKFHKHTRNDIRKAQKSGLYLKKIENEKELKKFYTLYFKNMKNFGSPQHSYTFFENLFELLNENVAGFNCYFKEKIAGSIIMFYNKSYGYISFNISDNELREYRPNDLLYWEMIKSALNKKIKYLDLGQVDKESQNDRAKGLYKFKKKWLGKLYDRTYFYYEFNKHSKDPVRKKDSLKKFRIIWRKLPIPIIKLIGPKICSQLAL